MLCQAQGRNCVLINLVIENFDAKLLYKSKNKLGWVCWVELEHLFLNSKVPFGGIAEILGGCWLISGVYWMVLGW